MRIANPIAADRNVLRRSLLASLLEVVERNARLGERMACSRSARCSTLPPDGDLPEEAPRLAIALTGPRALPAWQSSDAGLMDFYDLKGILSGAIRGAAAWERCAIHRPNNPASTPASAPASGWASARWA